MATVTVTSNELLRWKRGDVVKGIFSTDRTDPLDRGTDTRDVLDMLRGRVKPTDLLIPSGTADFGPTYPLYLAPSIIQADEGGATWKTSVKIDKTEYKPRGTPGFVLPSNGSLTMRYMNLIGRCYDPNEDGGLVGYDESPGNADVTFEACLLDGSVGCDWLIYTWVSAGLKRITVLNTALKFCRVGIGGLSGGGYFQEITAKNCRFIGNANGSTSLGESSKNDINGGGVLAAVVIRGGMATVWDSSIELTGLTKQYDPTGSYGCPRLAGITDDYSTAAQNTIVIDAQRNIYRHTPNLAAVWNDIDLAYNHCTPGYDTKAVALAEKQLADARGGSNPDGTVKIKQPA